MQARGNTRTIIKKVGEIQNLVGEAKGLHLDDKDQAAFALAQKKLDEAFNICLEITSLYDPV
jgi:hypothetical protein